MQVGKTQAQANAIRSLKCEVRSAALESLLKRGNTMTWQDGMYAAMAAYLRERGVDAVEVVNFEDETKYGGGCSTCSFTYVECKITYITSKGKYKTYQYDGAFGDFVSALARQ
jgi:hypothetical protein